jgi:hypothetical protein
MLAVRRRTCAAALWAVLAVGLALAVTASRTSKASPPWLGGGHGHPGPACGGEDCLPPDLGGTWYWLRSPEEEKRVIAGLYNRYCTRCHAQDGRGVWDIPGVPDFTNVRWQEYRSDAQRARIILEGRGAVMPPFRGTLTLEEAWAMGRYLRTFVPGSEVSRPDFGTSKKGGSGTPPARPVPSK